MSPGKVVASVFLLAGCLAAAARGQDAMPAPGTRVRLTIPCAAAGDEGPGRETARCRLHGTLVGTPGDSITVDLASSTVSYAWNDVSRLEMSQGRRTYWLAGAGIGFLAGAGATWLLVNAGGSTSLCDRSANQDALSSTECLGLVVLGGAAGGGIGAMIGNAIKGERWRDVPLEGLRVGFVPAQPGIALSWNLAF